MTTPIFIITRDRITVLKQCLEGYLKLGDIKIIILDNGSTYPPMVEWLNHCEHKVIKNPNPTGSFNDISEWVGQEITRYIQDNPCKYYVVTDPDIELDNPSPELLQYYKEVLEESGVICVGPMLRINDLPDCFHFKDQMIQSHIIQFWGEGHTRTTYKGILIQSAPIDTTFALYRSSFVFRRLNLGVRVHYPYTAKHLDWYMDTLHLTEEQRYYKDHATDISTMSMHLRKGGMG